MNTDVALAFALGWVTLVTWSIVTFSLLERAWPRHPYAPGARRIAIAAALVAIDAALAQLVIGLATIDGGRVLVVWLTGEVLAYVVHRAMHRAPLLWRFHRLHHDPSPLAWTTTWYVHPIDSVLHATTGVAAALLVGGGAPEAAWFVVGRRIWSIVLHANIAWPPSVLDAIVATPPFHARHHREDLPAANFAQTLPVLDRMFGTYRPPDQASARRR